MQEKMEYVSEITDVALVISKEKYLVEALYEDMNMEIPLFYRSLFFWSRPESEEDLIADVLYTKEPGNSLHSILAHDERFAFNLDAVMSTILDEPEKSDYWNQFPEVLCEKIGDLLRHAEEAIESGSVNEKKMILCSQVSGAQD